MQIDQILTRDKSLAVRGICALGIFVFHILIGVDISPIFNLWGGMFVAVFLVLSGYGINESFHRHGLQSYWAKRFDKVILPTIVFASGFCLLYPESNFETWCKDVLYQMPTYWFVFHIVKCYAAYWLARRFFGRYWVWMLLVCAVVCLNYRACGFHLESEQAFSFLFGVLLSEHKGRFNQVEKKKMWGGMVVLFLIGLFFYCLKALPAVHVYIGTVAYNYLLCPFRLSWGIAATFLLAFLPVEKSMVLGVCGKRSLDIYIAHIPLLPLITTWQSVPTFVLYSLLSFALLCLYTLRLQKRLSVSLTLYIVVNALFVAKYSSRLSPTLFPYITLTAVLAYYLFLIYGMQRLLRWRRTSWAFAALCFISMFVVQYAIDPYSLNVDRWSALHFPIQNMLNGVYPYIAHTHLGGNASPFPVWQLLHVPFYLLGNVGLSFFVVVAFFVWTVWRQWGGRCCLMAALLLAVSPAVWYEVAVRSDFITNILLLGGAINMCVKRVSVEWVSRHAVWLSVAIALFASTRILTLIPIALLALPFWLRMSGKKKVLTVIVFSIVFLATFLPFALWDWHDFFHHENNPWSLQTRQGFSVDFLLFVPLAVILALTWRGDVQRYFVNVSTMLLLFVGITIIHRMYAFGNWDLFASLNDITYFNSLLPFVIPGVFLGKGCYVPQKQAPRCGAMAGAEEEIKMKVGKDRM